MGDRCMIKGCRNAQAAELKLTAAPLRPSSKVANWALQDTGPVYVRVCLKHAREITEGKTDVSIGEKGEK